MEQSELLHFVVEALERSGLQYFVTGSIATIFFGGPLGNRGDLAGNPEAGRVGLNLPCLR
jgi:hypothetical protein